MMHDHDAFTPARHDTRAEQDMPRTGKGNGTCVTPGPKFWARVDAAKLYVSHHRDERAALSVFVDRCRVVVAPAEEPGVGGQRFVWLPFPPGVL